MAGFVEMGWLGCWMLGMRVSHQGLLFWFGFCYGSEGRFWSGFRSAGYYLARMESSNPQVWSRMSSSPSRYIIFEPADAAKGVLSIWFFVTWSGLVSEIPKERSAYWEDSISISSLIIESYFFQDNLEKGEKMGLSPSFRVLFTITFHILFTIIAPF